MRIMLGLFLIAILTTAASLAKDPKVVDYYPIKDGSIWEYTVADSQKKDQKEEKVTISNVVKKGNETKAIEQGRGTNPEEIFEIKSTPEEIRLFHNNGIAKMEWIIWKPDSKKGSSWQGKIDLGAGGIVGDKKIKSNITTTVGGVEEIKVPAGKFNAQVVTTTVTISIPDRQNISMVTKVWLADEVGIVRTESSTGGGPKGTDNLRVTELKKYTPGK